MEILNFELHLNQNTKVNVPQNQNKELKEAEELRGAAEEVSFIWSVVDIKVYRAALFSDRVQGTSCRWSVNCLDVDWFPNSSADIVLGHEQENIGCSSARLIQDHRSKHADTSEIKAELPAARLVLLEALSSRSFGGNRWNRGACRRWEESAGGGVTVWSIGKKSSWREWINRINVMFTGFENVWRIWTAAGSSGEQTDMFELRGERGGRLRCDSSQTGDSVSSHRPTTLLQDQMSFFWEEWYLRQSKWNINSFMFESHCLCSGTYGGSFLPVQEKNKMKT